jgi:hypothetical protein
MVQFASFVVPLSAVTSGPVHTPLPFVRPVLQRPGIVADATVADSRNAATFISSLNVVGW